MPLRGTHPREHGIVVNAGVVHQHLHRSVLQQGLYGGARRSRVREIELNRGRAAAGGGDFARDCRRRSHSAVRMNIDEVTRFAEAPANGRADAAAAAGDQSANGRFIHG